MGGFKADMSMTFKRNLALLAAGLAAAALSGATSFAAEAHNLVGTWKLTGEMQASVRLGAASAHHPEYGAPSIGKPADAWTIVIEGQQGRAFHGYAMSPQGRQEPIVGVVTHNSEQLLISGMESGMYGELVGDQIEFCFMDHEPDRAGVSCFIAAKEQS
jgi:hypothetical protein